MKKAKAGNCATAARTKRAPKNIDEYLAGIPEPARTTLKKIRTVIQSAVPPGTIETISYGMPAFKHNGVLVWFAAFSNHCSFFPTPSVIKALKEELKGFHTAKGTIQFPTDKPLPSALVKKMVKLRVEQVEAKKAR
jgi:uncharacterized protein YdhG (YjbR/CyaY superfamily)